MDWQTAFNIAFGVAGGGVLLYVQTTRDELKTLRHDLKNSQQVVSTLREFIPMTYASIPDLDKAIGAVSIRITDVFTVMSRLEGKIDKVMMK